MTDWNLVGHFHHATAWLAMACGAMVLLGRKGTRSHRRWGHAYVSAMLALNLSALGIYRLFDGFGIFHVFALVSLATLAAALIPALLRMPKGGWVELHAYFMSWSYIGLLCAAASELLSRVPAARHAWQEVIVALGLPGTGFGFTVAFASVVVMFAGGVMMAYFMPRTLAPWKRAANRHLSSPVSTGVTGETNQ